MRGNSLREPGDPGSIPAWRRGPVGRGSSPNSRRATWSGEELTMLRPMATVRQSQLVQGQHDSAGVAQGGAHIAEAGSAVRSRPSCHEKHVLHPLANTGISKRISIDNLLIPLDSFLGSSLPSSIPHSSRQLCAIFVRVQLKSSRCAAAFATPARRTAQNVLPGETVGVTLVTLQAHP